MRNLIVKLTNWLAEPHQVEMDFDPVDSRHDIDTGYSAKFSVLKLPKLQLQLSMSLN